MTKYPLSPASPQSPNSTLDLDDKKALFHPGDSPPPYSLTDPANTTTGEGGHGGHGEGQRTIQGAETLRVGRARVLLCDGTKHQRTLFLRNVYLILGLQTLVFCGIFALFLFTPLKGQILSIGFFKFWSCWTAGTLASCFVTALYKSMRQPPVNLVLLAAVTLCLGVSIGALKARLEADCSIFITCGIISSVCFLVVLFTFQKRFEFTPMIAAFYIWTLLLLAYPVLLLCLPRGEGAWCWWGALKLLLLPTFYCTYLLAATQLLVKDRKRALLSDEYVFGAVQIVMYLVALVTKFLFSIFHKCCPCCACCCDQCAEICEEL